MNAHVQFPMMRPFLAGICAILIVPLLLAQVARAQAKPEVESIGFQNIYRPDCWTPLIVRLVPETAKADTYQLQVKQEDLDRDHPIYSKSIAVTGNADGKSREQKFRIYFHPQPTDGGLPDAMDPARNRPSDLQEQLQVTLADKNGKFISTVPVTTTITNIDPRTGSMSSARGARLILAVSDGPSAPAWKDYDQSLGLLESPHVVSVQTRDLPENVLGYDAVDAILWLGADPAELKSGGDDKYRALESYVRRGGMLVICTPLEWQRLLGFGDLLPVVIDGVGTRQNAQPMDEIVRRRADALPIEQARPIVSMWQFSAVGPFNVAHASAKDGALVEEWIEWGDEARPRSTTQPSGASTTRPAGTRDRTPWLVRKPYGTGGVTWVAQDLGDVTLKRQVGVGWPYVWDRVFGWNNETLTLTNQTDDVQKRPYAPASGVDLGDWVRNSIELNSKSMTLLTLAIVFFIAYWLVAGPGVYAWLASRRQTAASWFMFAASALAATLITVLLVKITMRGGPELKHLSIVRAASDPSGAAGTADEPAHVVSRFGMYIPRDGEQNIELKNMAPGSVAAICAYAIHPQHLDNSTVPNDPGPEYQVFLRDPASEEPAKIAVPYRSTLKKFDADWTGKITGKVQGAAKLIEGRYIEGRLTNGTGVRLKNIYIAFNYNSPIAGNAGDWVLYLPSWDPGVTIDLMQAFNEHETDPSKSFMPGISEGRRPEGKMKVRGLLKRDWEPYWYGQMRGNSFIDRSFDDTRNEIRASIPVLSFFGRLSPMKNTDLNAPNRFELLRRGARKYDVSAALASGGLVVVAEPAQPMPLPFPMEVEGDRIDGTGSVLYQFVLPLDKSVFNSPTTQPTSD